MASMDKAQIVQFFIEKIENLDIVDSELRSKGAIMLGQKHQGENLDNLALKEGLGAMKKKIEVGNDGKSSLV